MLNGSGETRRDSFIEIGRCQLQHWNRGIIEASSLPGEMMNLYRSGKIESYRALLLKELFEERVRTWLFGLPDTMRVP